MTETSQPVITARKLSKTFSTGGIQRHVLRNIDLDIFPGDFTVIMGASGAGKSTLLYALSGMDTPTLGEVKIDGQSIVGLNEKAMARLRRTRCGFVFQQVHLLQTMSLMDNVIAAGGLVSPVPQVVQRARDLFDQVGLGEAIWEKFPAQVSGGEASRAAIVRALINQPSVIFADEPTGNLDQTSGRSVLDVLRETNQRGQSIVMVTHDVRSALCGNRVIFLRDGVITGDLRLNDDSLDQASAEASLKAAREDQLRAFLIEMGW